MRCEKCNREINKEYTELRIRFNIKKPETMEVLCKNRYKNLSMADTVTYGKALHLALDEALTKIGVRIFVDKT